MPPRSSFKPGGSSRVGTSGIAAKGNNAHNSHAGGYFAAEINAPNNGGPAAAIIRWVVFWMPRARPLQYGPANSVIAVASSPLSSTAITEMATIRPACHRELR